MSASECTKVPAAAKRERRAAAQLERPKRKPSECHAGCDEDPATARSRQARGEQRMHKSHSVRLARKARRRHDAQAGSLSPG